MEFFGRLCLEIGEPDKTLILKGNIKIQWGKKLIDLLDSNGNLNSKSQSLIKSVSSIEDIKLNGFYYYNNQILVKTKDNLLVLTSESGTTYISFLQELNTSEEEKYTALKNIGLVYPSKKDSNIYPKNGIIYIEDILKLFIVKNGYLTEYNIDIPDTINKPFTIINEEDSEGALIIEGKGTSNGLKFNTLKIYSSDNYSIYDSTVAHQFKIDEDVIVDISSEGIKTDEIKSFSSTSLNGYRIYKLLGSYIFDIDKVNVRNTLITKNLLSDSNSFIGAEFKLPNEELNINHYPRYSDELNEQISEEILNNDNVILPKKWISRISNSIEDVTDKTISDINLYTFEINNLYEGKLILFEILGNSSNPLKARFKIKEEYTDYYNFYNRNVLISENNFKINTLLLARYKDSKFTIIETEDEDLNNSIAYIYRNTLLEITPNSITEKASKSGTINLNVSSEAVWNILCDVDCLNKIKGCGNSTVVFHYDKNLSFESKTIIVTIKDAFCDRLINLGLSNNLHLKQFIFTLQGKKVLNLLSGQTTIPLSGGEFEYILSSSFPIKDISSEYSVSFNENSETLTINALIDSTLAPRTVNIDITTEDEQTYTIIINQNNG